MLHYNSQNYVVFHKVLLTIDVRHLFLFVVYSKLQQQYFLLWDLNFEILKLLHSNFCGQKHPQFLL